MTSVDVETLAEQRRLQVAKLKMEKQQIEQQVKDLSKAIGQEFHSSRLLRDNMETLKEQVERDRSDAKRQREEIQRQKSELDEERSKLERERAKLERRKKPKCTAEQARAVRVERALSEMSRDPSMFKKIALNFHPDKVPREYHHQATILFLCVQSAREKNVQS